MNRKKNIVFMSAFIAEDALIEEPQKPPDEQHLCMKFANTKQYKILITVLLCPPPSHPRAIVAAAVISVVLNNCFSLKFI